MSPLLFERGSFEVSVGTAECKTTNEEHVHLILQEANLPLDLNVASVTGMATPAGELPLLQTRESSARQLICTETTSNLPLKRVATAVPTPWMRRANFARLPHASPQGQARSAYRSPPGGDKHLFVQERLHSAPFTVPLRVNIFDVRNPSAFGQPPASIDSSSGGWMPAPIRFQNSTPDAQSQMLNPRCSIPDAQSQMLNSRCSILPAFRQANS